MLKLRVTKKKKESVVKGSTVQGQKQELRALTPPTVDDEVATAPKTGVRKRSSVKQGKGTSGRTSVR